MKPGIGEGATARWSLPTLIREASGKVVGLAVRTPAAAATRWQERSDDVIADFELVHAGSEFLHDAGAFVSADHGQRRACQIPLRMCSSE
jgi:hypothetical protein